jgi:hypothetical protein
MSCLDGETPAKGVQGDPRISLRSSRLRLLGLVEGDIQIPRITCYKLRASPMACAARPGTDGSGWLAETEGLGF